MLTALRFKIAERRYKKSIKKYKKKWPDYVDDEYNCGPYKFIWGVKSDDCLIAGDANIYTMNDIDIDFNRLTNQYELGVEMIYRFISIQDEIEYYRELLDKFTKYVNDNGLDVKQHCNPAFSGFGIQFKADTIEELYIQFKIFVIGYCTVLEELNDDDYRST